MYPAREHTRVVHNVHTLPHSFLVLMNHRANVLFNIVVQNVDVIVSNNQQLISAHQSVTEKNTFKGQAIYTQ